jgi:uroporphyrin-III C-methyltransferase
MADDPAQGSGYHVTLTVAGAAVTVVGASGAALGHIAALRDAGARVTVVATEVTAAVVDLAERGLLTWHARDFDADLDLPGTRLVVAATGDAARDGCVAARCQAHDVWCVTPAPAVTRPRPARGEVTLVGAGPGDPGLLTLAGRAALRAADVVVTDRLVPLAALRELAPHAEVVDVGKVPRGRATPQHEINRLLVEHALAGRRVVRFKGGDSFLFGRGGEELAACAAAGVPTSVVPGVSSALAVPALAGIPVTHRGLTQGVSVVSGHVPPGDERSSVNYAALARSGTTIVLLMAVATLPDIARALLAAGLPTDTPAATVADGSLTHQRVVRGTLADIAERVAASGVKPPAVTVIGAVAGFDPTSVDAP